MTGERTHTPEAGRWQAKDYLVAAVLVVVGFAFKAIAPAWISAAIGAIGFVAYLAWAARRNRKPAARPMPPRYRPPGSHG